MAKNSLVVGTLQAQVPRPRLRRPGFRPCALTLALSALGASAPALAQQCSAGSYSTTGSEPCTPASVGYFVPSSGATSQTIAPVGSFVNIIGATAATQAAPGSYVATLGASAATLAQPGSYVSISGATAATQAAPGSYVATSGASAATLAQPGSYVSISGATAATHAAPGSYVATSGASAATLAQPGNYVGMSGATAATQAAPGSYVATPGASAPTPAPAGSYVSMSGATAATQAAPGSYVATPGASAATLAQPGSYVGVSGATAATQAPPGYYAPMAGGVTALSCPSGTNSYGTASACRIVSGSYVGGAPGVTPLLNSNFGTGGSHDVGTLGAGDTFNFAVANASTDSATPSDLTTLTLLDVLLGGDDDPYFALTGFTPGMTLTVASGWFPFQLQAQTGLPADAFSFTLTLSTDQYADYGSAGRQFTYTFTGVGATTGNDVPEPGSLALVLGALGAAALGGRMRARRRAGVPR